MKKLLTLTLIILASIQLQAADYSKISVRADELHMHDGDTVRYVFSSKDRVVKGDGTAVIGSRSLRLVGYDTPEIKAPGLGMLFDQPYAERALRFANSLLENAKRIYLHVITEEGEKGRLLAHIEIDGKFLGAELVREGYAYESVSAFPIEEAFPKKLRSKLQNEILNAWFESPIFSTMKRNGRLRFINPYVWRKINLHTGLTYNQALWDKLNSSELADVLKRGCENSENNARTQLSRHEARLADENNKRNFVIINGKKQRVRYRTSLSGLQYRNEVCN